MADPWLSEIRLMAFNYPPRYWAQCNGQLLPIAQNQALFSLLGTSYGGDGQRTFGLPDLRGRVPLGMSQTLPLAAKGGVATVTLNMQQVPQHTHTAQATTTAAGTDIAAGHVLAAVANFYGPAASLTNVEPSTIGNAGQNQPHENCQPYLTVGFCIALQGAFPSRN